MRKMPFGWICLAFLVFVGCSQKTANQPEASSSPPAPSKPESSATAKPPATGESSLQALQQGKQAEQGPLKEIFFEYDKYDLKADARQTLQANAAWLKANGSARVEVEGHCDERGTNEYNLALGAKRAQAAKDYLVTLGVAAQRVSTISYGKELPVCREHAEECWQKNRRDRFVVMAPRPAS